MTLRTTSTPFAPIGEQWLERLKDEGKSQSTLDCYARDIRDVAVASGLAEAAQLSKLDQCAIDAIAATWRLAGACETTVIRRFSALRIFASYLARQHGINVSALLSADFPTAPKGARPAVEQSAVGLLLAEHLAESWRDARDSAVFAVQSDAGLTSAEAVKLDVANVDLEACLVRVVETHLAPRIAAISRRSRDLIADYLRALPFTLAEDEPLFVTSKRKRLGVRSAQLSFRRRRTRLGVSPEATLMGLRHAMAARLIAEGIAPDLLATALGVLGATADRYFDGNH